MRINFTKFAELINYTAQDILDKLKTVDGPDSGLDADLLDGQQGAYYLPADTYTAADILTKLKTVDGPDSGLDADLLDGKQAADFVLKSERTSEVKKTLIDTRNYSAEQAVTYFDITGLDGDVEGNYQLIFKFFSPSTSDSRFLYLRPNNEDIEAFGCVSHSSLDNWRSSVSRIGGVQNDKTGSLHGIVDFSVGFSVGGDNKNERIVSGRFNTARAAGSGAYAGYMGTLGGQIGANLTSIRIGISAGTIYGKSWLYKLAI